jgi:endonuclease/exonuclease/phosphatase (EEP) superfamily protein YafD
VRDLFKLRIRLWDLLAVCGGILATATVIGFLGNLWWFFDLFSNFRLQYLFGLISLTLILLVPRRYIQSAVFGLFAVVNVLTIVPVYFVKQADLSPASQVFRGLLMNVNTETGRPGQVAAAIHRFAPDILALEEVDDRWLLVLSNALRNYPYSKAMPRDDNFGIALYSKYPFEAEIRQLGEAEVPSVVAKIQLTGGALTVITTHPLPPGNAENSRLRDEQLLRLAEIVGAKNEPILVLGDLNATPWCYGFKKLLNVSGLRDASQGHGILPTWPTFLPIMLIPIDHCLYSAGIRVTKEAVGPNVGSDHYPVVVDFMVASSGTKSR